MKDDRGLYYYPSPGNHRERMYVKEAEGVVWFRMWDAGGGVIVQAAVVFHINPP